MTPDFKRLCEAAESAHEDWVKGGYSVKPGEYTIEATPEAIVRAVLMALREPSESLEEACRGIVIAAGGDNWDIDYKADQMRAAMIDHILAERKP
jgi:aminopeptidase-like protein